MSARHRRRTVIIAGHQADATTAAAHLDDPDATVRAAALGALDRLGSLTHEHITAAFADAAPEVRRRAAELAGTRSGMSLTELLDDDEPTVIEVAAWACGEQERVDDDVLDRLIVLATESTEPLVREAGAAALGAIGDRRGLQAILTACTDKPNVRRRAVLALAPFDGPDVEAAIDHALEDRDWQVRQAAEDLRRAVGEIDLS
jgi:HEAT repeat protein